MADVERSGVRIGCILYVPLPALLKPIARQRGSRDAPGDDHVLVLFMN